MKLNFCTLFNSAYLSRGLLMFHSLLQHCNDAHLFVFAFDEECYEFLKSKNYPSLTVISLKEFEDVELLRIKPTRSAGEYCWTCTASTILYSIEKFNLNNCTYIDADMQFFSDPTIIWQEAIDNSVLITEHHYSTLYDQSEESGIYCVQFVGFRNNANGLKVLRWWRNSCIDWCFARNEDGKFGDQKYLDDWTTRFEGVHVVKNLGAGIAPWNCRDYSFNKNGNTISAKGISRAKTFNVVFFHFHGLVFYKNETVMLTGSIYELKSDTLELFYKPYIIALQKIRNEILSQSFKLDSQGSKDSLSVSPGSNYQKNLFVKTFKSFIKKSISPTNKFIRHYNHYYFINSFTQQK